MAATGFTSTRTAAAEPEASARLEHMHGFLPSRRSVPVVRKEELAEGVFSLSIRDGYAARNSAGRNCSPARSGCAGPMAIR